MSSNKIFIIGLPRTATTSICSAFLTLGYKTAHTAYTLCAIEDAQVIADTPVYSNYQQLDAVYPNAKFIYLQREMDHWIPSIKQLLNRMATNVLRNDGGFNPHIKQSFKAVFSPFTLENINNDAFLAARYHQHENDVKQYFSHRKEDLLSINIAAPESFNQLLAFLNIDIDSVTISTFEHMNIAGKVTAWNDIKHPNKIPSTRQGKIDKYLGFN